MLKVISIAVILLGLLFPYNFYDLDQSYYRTPSSISLKSCRKSFSNFVTKVWINPWKFENTLEEEIQKILSSNSNNSIKISSLFHLILEKRISSFSVKKQKELRKILSIALDSNHPIHQRYKRQLGPSEIGYDTIKRKVIFSVLPEDSDDWTITHYVALIHEMQHAMYDIQSDIALPLKLANQFLNAFTISMIPISKTAIYFNEIKAIGAQWELVSRIPENIRIKYLNDFKEINKSTSEIKDHNKNQKSRKNVSADNHSRLLKIIEGSLKNAHLPKNEFVEKLKPIHKYEYLRMIRPSLKEKSLTILWTTIATYNLFYILSSEDQEIWPIPPLDLYALILLISD